MGKLFGADPSRCSAAEFMISAPVTDTIEGTKIMKGVMDRDSVTYREATRFIKSKGKITPSKDWGGYSANAIGGALYAIYSTQEEVYAKFGGSFSDVEVATSKQVTSQETSFTCPKLEDQNPDEEPGSVVNLRIKPGHEKGAKKEFIDRVRNMGICANCPFYGKDALQVAEYRQGVAEANLETALHKVALAELSQSIPQPEIQILETRK